MNFSNVDSFVGTRDYIDIEIHATHLNYVNGNSVLYTSDAAKAGSLSWVKPFNKPQLLYHDRHSDPVGRITGYEVKDMSDNLDEPPDYVKLSVRITDKEAIGKVLKGLYYTCSVGSTATGVRCSVCNQSLTEDGLCEHEKGSITDKGEKVYWVIDEIKYKENSFVNNPADPYSRIVSIDIGQGPIPYQEFLDHRDTLISELSVEEDMKDAKLSTATRKKLSASAFCGPGKSFPAHDKAHVLAGLRLLNRSNFSDSTKAKIKACLYRKGKRYGITPSGDELQETPNLLTWRIDEDFSDEEVQEINDFFKENPDSDLPEVEDAEEEPEDQEDSQEEPEISFEDVQKKTKKEVISYTEKLIEDHETALKSKDTEIDALKAKVEKLNNTITDNESILNSKEDEISKLLDDHARSELAYKTVLVDNIVDLKIAEDSNLSRSELKEKYIKRQIDSLVDTINDLRTEVKEVTDETRVDDPTLNNTENETGAQEDHEEEVILPEGVDPKFAPFYK